MEYLTGLFVCIFGLGLCPLLLFISYLVARFILGRLAGFQKVPLADGEWRGVVHTYADLEYAGRGVLIVEESGIKLPFKHQRNGRCPLYPGDKVTFAVKNGQIFNVQRYSTNSPAHDQFWCAQCQKCYGYSEVREAENMTDWGIGCVYFCKVCRKEVSEGKCPDKAEK